MTTVRKCLNSRNNSQWIYEISQDIPQHEGTFGNVMDGKRGRNFHRNHHVYINIEKTLKAKSVRAFKPIMIFENFLRILSWSFNKTEPTSSSLARAMASRRSCSSFCRRSSASSASCLALRSSLIISTWNRRTATLCQSADAKKLCTRTCFFFFPLPSSFSSFSPFFLSFFLSFFFFFFSLADSSSLSCPSSASPPAGVFDSYKVR